MAFLLYFQPGVETTLVPCLWFNAKLENICCPTSMCFLMGHANTSYKKAWFCQHLGGVVSLMLSKNVMFWTRVICSVGIKSCKSICAPGDMSWYSNKKQCTNALFPTHENKLLSHQTFEVTVEYTRGGQCPAQPVKHSPAGRQAGRLPSLSPRDGSTPATCLSCFLVFGRRNIQVSDPSPGEPAFALAEGGCLYTCRKPRTPANSLLLSPVRAWGQT